MVKGCPLGGVNLLVLINQRLLRFLQSFLLCSWRYKVLVKNLATNSCVKKLSSNVPKEAKALLTYLLAV